MLSSDDARRLARDEESAIERRKERAAEVEEILRAGDAAIGSVNLFEVADYFMRREGWSDVATQVALTQLVDEAITVIDAGRDIARRGAVLRARHYGKRSRELSLADCMLLASVGPTDSLATSDPGVAAVARVEEISLVPLRDAAGRL